LLAASGVIDGKLEAPSVLAQALHYSNYWIAFRGWGGIAQGTGVYWSLAVEEHFYLLFPAFYWTLLRADLSPKQQRTAFFAICGLVLLWRSILVFGFNPIPDRTYIATDTRLDSLLFGCGLAVFGNPALDLEPKARPGLRDLALLGAGIGALLASFVIRDPTFRETLRYTIQGLGLYPVFVTAIRFPGYGPLKLLGTAPMRYVGKISYSLYLMHHVVLEGVGRRMPDSPVMHAVLSLGISVALASSVWYLVEEPCAVLRRKLAARGMTRVASAGADAAAARATRT
jgi:peptidoglycan/LPS O-acetylase OafA/YrhL